MAAKNDIIGASETYAPLVDTETQNRAPMQTPSEAFLCKTIHPPTAVGGYMGMPTNDCRSQVVTEWVDNRLLQLPYTEEAGGTTAPIAQNDIEGYAFLHTTGPNFPVMVYVKVAGTWRIDVANTRKLTIYDMNNFWRDATLYRPCYKSYTYYANTTGFNDVGSVTTAQFNPALEYTGVTPALLNKEAFAYALFKSGAYLRESDNWPKEIYVKYNAFVVSDDMHKALSRNVKDESLLTVGERNQLAQEKNSTNAWIMLAQTAIVKYEYQRRLNKYLQLNGPDADLLNLPRSRVVMGKPYHLTPDVEFQIINFGAQGNDISGNGDGAIVPSMEQLTSLSRRSFTCPAREGQFVVNRLNTATPHWYATSHNKQAFSPFGLYECWYSFNDDLGNDNYLRFRTRSTTGQAITCLDAFWSDDWTWSWTVFDGMVANVNLNSSVSSASAQLIQVKGYNGYEIQPSAKSPWAGLQSIAPMADVMSIQHYERSSAQMKDGTISANNFLGALARGALQVGKFLLPSLVSSLASRKAKAKTAKPLLKKAMAVTTARARAPLVVQQERRNPVRPRVAETREVVRQQPQAMVLHTVPQARPRSRSRSRGRTAAHINRELENMQHRVANLQFKHEGRRRRRR